MRTPLRRLAVFVLAVFAMLLLPRTGDAYSVQTHEQLIDLVWKQSLVPLLEKRYPGITGPELLTAHSFAYGGAAIQDLGYYPFGNAFFSDLTHYVRSGDFVDSLLRNARTANELAFAVGALSHYVGDTIGHSEATNPSVAEEFPKLGAKYGPVVTYEENPHDHVRTEFAFDVNEIAKHRFAPRKYLNHVGLNVATGLLARAFFDTYGLDLQKTVKVERRNLYGYRWSVRHFLPRVAYAETVLHRGSLPPDTSSPDLDKLKADLVQSGLDNHWAPYRGHAGPGTYLLAGIIWIAPPVGPLAMLKIRGPNETAENLYVGSVNNATANLRGDLLNLRTPPALTGPRPLRQTNYPNRDLDTGQPVRPGVYGLTDRTYAKLLATLTADPKRKIPLGLEEDMLAFYSDPNAPDTMKRKPERWAEIQKQLAVFKTMTTIPEP